MAIMLAHSPGALKGFRKKAMQLQHQATFRTPLQNLMPFVSAIVCAFSPLREGRIIIQEVIFEPRTLNALLVKHSLTPPPSEDTCQLKNLTLQAGGEAASIELLAATLADPIDFFFLPSPHPFMMYADHDEYATFFAGSKSDLNRIVNALSKIGLAPQDYQRRL